MSRRPPLFRPRSPIAALLLLGIPAGVAGQSGEGWNDTRVLELVAQARSVRQATVVDSTLTSYRSRAQGFVYFFLDRTDEDEHTLIKADQLVLDVMWRAPDRTRQRIVGMRDEKVLPTNINYHLDHLTVVQDDFGDLIRLGDGDEVAAVVHPVAPGAETLYEYRLADSLSLQYGGAPEPVRVYRVLVAPKDRDRPGFVGSLYLDRDTGGIVRLSFTFTASSYVDPYLDYIRIAIDNALWMGRHWLPHRQEVELRRELPQLDFMAGSIIRGRWEIRDYELNAEIPDFYFSGPRVTAAPRELRETFPFEDDLYSDLDREGLAPSPALEDIEQQVRDMAIASALRGLSPFRLYASSVSDVARRNRAEGWAVGVGATLRSGVRPIRAVGGYAFGAERGWLRSTATIPAGEGVVTISGRWNEAVDIGPFPGPARLINTIATLGGVDYLDPYWASGGSITWERPLHGGLIGRVTGTVERHESASLTIDDANTSFRPVLPVTEGTLAAADLSVSRPDQGDGVFGSLALRAGRLDRSYAAVRAEVGWSRAGPSHAVDRSISLTGGWVSSRAPDQELQLVGGLGSLPGFDYRSAVADRHVLARGWVRIEAGPPWVSLRATAAAGWSELTSRALPLGWVGETRPGWRASAGIGVDLLWEVLRFDLARGLPDGEWSFFFSVSPRFHPWL